MMSFEIQERLTKAQEKVEKCKATIERHKAQAEKKLQILQQNGWSTNLEDYRGSDNREAWSLAYDYKYKLEDIKGAERKLEEAKQIVRNWEAKLDKQVSMELTLANEVHIVVILVLTRYRGLEV